jgi:hypothetical protein
MCKPLYPDDFNIDLIYGRNVYGENANWITLATVVRFHVGKIMDRTVCPLPGCQRFSSWTDLCGSRSLHDIAGAQDVRVGSKADVCSALPHVRFGPKADIRRRGLACADPS